LIAKIIDLKPHQDNNKWTELHERIGGCIIAMMSQPCVCNQILNSITASGCVSEDSVAEFEQVVRMNMVDHYSF
jgi:hypothetical protein